MDNSSIHRSEEFEEHIPRWKQKGLIIKYLIPYAPELNLIEILWRHIKYFWSPFSAYQCMEVLRAALEHILKDFGSKYPDYFCLSTYKHSRVETGSLTIRVFARAGKEARATQVSIAEVDVRQVVVRQEQAAQISPCQIERCSHTSVQFLP